MNPLIFIVEDSAFYRLLLKRLLENNGFQTIAFENPTEAIEQFQDALPKLIISDIEMPKMDGFEFYHAIQKLPLNQEIPFLYVSSKDDLKCKELAKTLSTREIIKKPICLELLLGTIHETILQTSLKETKKAVLKTSIPVTGSPSYIHQ